MSEGRRVMVLPCTGYEFSRLTPEEAAVLEAAVYIEGVGGAEGPFEDGWSSVGAEVERAAGEPVLAMFEYEGMGGACFSLISREEDGSFRCDEPEDEEEEV